MTETGHGSRRVARASAAFGVASVVGNLAQLVYTAITARSVGPAEFAPYAAALLALSLGSVAATAGLSSAILRAPHWSRERERGLVSVVMLIGGIVLVLMLAFGTAWDRISGVAGSGDVVRLCAPLAVLTPLGLIGMTLVRREGRGPRAASIEAVAQVGGFVVGATAVTISKSTDSLVVAMYVSSLLTIVLTWGTMRRLPWVGRPSAAREEIAFTLRLIPLGFSSLILVQTPTLWAGRNLGSDQYARFFRGSLVNVILSVQVSGALSKAASPEYRTIEPESRARSVTELVMLAWAATSLLFAVLAGAASPVVAVLLGPSWAGTGAWIVATSVGSALSVPAFLLGGFSEFTANYRALYLSQALALVLMIASIAVTSRSSIAEWTPAIAQAVMFGGWIAFIALFQRHSLRWRPVGWGLVLHTLLALAAFVAVREAVQAGNVAAGLPGEVVGAIGAGLGVALLVAGCARWLPAGRVLAERGLLPTWMS